MKKIELYIQALCEAYSVLSDPLSRALYDRFGYQQLHSKWKFFLTNRNPKEGRLGAKSEDYIRFFVHANNHMSQFRSQKKLANSPEFEEKKIVSAFDFENINVECRVSLKDIYESKPVTLSFNRKLLEPVSCLDISTQVQKRVVLGAGIFQNPKIVFTGEGHYLVGRGYSDLIVTFNILQDSQFAREGLHLVLKKKISLKQALTQHSFSIEHIDGRELNLTVSEVVSPQKIVTFEGLGFVGKCQSSVQSLKKRFSFGLVPENIAQIQRRVKSNQVFDFCYDPTFRQIDMNCTSITAVLDEFELNQNDKNLGSKGIFVYVICLDMGFGNEYKLFCRIMELIR